MSTITEVKEPILGNDVSGCTKGYVATCFEMHGGCRVSGLNLLSM